MATDIICNPRIPGFSSLKVGQLLLGIQYPTSHSYLHPYLFQILSSPSDSSSCTSESDLESFTVDEVIGELSELRLRRITTVANPLPPRKKPRTTTKEFIAKKKRNNSFNEDIRERCERMNGMVLSWNVDLYFYFPISTYPSLNRAREERDCVLIKFTISLLCD